MSATKTDLLPVPGADIYYEVRGTGPLLLVSESGEGDARRSADLVDRLVARYTVVTYDRRGLSRSTVGDPAQPLTIATHAADVHHLLAALTDEPALMLGCSFGALIGLHLAVDHPGQVSTLIAHEPVAPRLLPGPERDSTDRKLGDIQETYRREGWAVAVRKVAAVLGIDPASQEVEPGLRPRPIGADRGPNFEFFLEHDFTAIRRDTLAGADVAALKGGPPRVVPAAGRTTPRDVFDYRCAQVLAELLGGVDLVEFPGGHNGNLTHPRAFAARVCEVLDGPV
ncbi:MULTISPECIES: alpha/beta fold hydrolase [Streptosporangium]|uniref:Pimeloyl-ACP methyl ester carboxylesterase n=1 Tax=Streptosporangium brasiliense TaxID=47480 RepID=A0ABT9RA16_9ACTN|nr:alpha/beta hydrolase [Streptosporangium brasiliense]MDP9865686.1 pimeloyl-ACP methyl ester carboxylesterase [Streptosporangium brasiliense]